MKSVRAATRRDSEACAELCRQALEELATQRGGSLFARHEIGLVAKELMRPGGLERLLADRQRKVVVGLIDEAVVGMAIARTEPVGDLNLGILEACYVEQDARGVEVGRGLLATLIAWLASRDCGAVDAQALPGNRAMKSFFEASGFKARLIVMHKELS